MSEWTTASQLTHHAQRLDLPRFIAVLTLVSLRRLTRDTGLLALMAWLMSETGFFFLVDRKIGVSSGYDNRRTDVHRFAGEYFVCRRELSIGLPFKLARTPLLIGLFYVVLLGGCGELTQLSIFEAATLAIEKNHDPQLVTLMIGIGIPLSFLTLPFWHQALNIIA